MGVIKGICISEKRGTAKHEIEEAILVKDWGIQGDAHAGHWHRQVSLLSYEKIEEFRKKGADIELGAFGENLIVSGYDFRNLAVGTRFQCGEAVLEMTQIGKECHSHCEIYKRMGECIMPREGVFAVVLQGGKIKKGDILEIDCRPWAPGACYCLVANSKLDCLYLDGDGRISCGSIPYGSCFAGWAHTNLMLSPVFRARKVAQPMPEECAALQVIELDRIEDLLEECSSHKEKEPIWLDIYRHRAR